MPSLLDEGLRQLVRARLELVATLLTERLGVQVTLFTEVRPTMVAGCTDGEVG